MSRLNDETARQAHAIYETGASLTSVARDLGIARETLREAFARLQLPVRPQGRNRNPRTIDEFGEVIEKWCPRCRAMRPVADFYGNRSSIDGLQSYCAQHMREARARSEKKRRANNGAA